MNNVVALKGAEAGDVAREAFIAHAAQSYELYVKEKGYTPDALVLTWCGIRQEAVTGWLVRGESEEAVTTVQSLAAMGVLKSIMNP